MNYVKIAVGIIFIIFGIITLIGSKEEGSKCNLKNPFLSGFGLILISEMGDKSQIASGLFAIKYNALIVFISVIIVLTLLSIMAIYLGKFLVEKLNRRIVSYFAGGLFLIIGITCFF